MARRRRRRQRPTKAKKSKAPPRDSSSRAHRPPRSSTGRARSSAPDDRSARCAASPKTRPATSAHGATDTQFVGSSLPLLQHGDVTVKGRMPDSSNGTFLVELTQDGTVGHAVYKPG